MNKTDLVERIHGKSGISRTMIRRVLNETMEEIVEALVSGDRVTLTDFGSFRVQEKGRRSGEKQGIGEWDDQTRKRVVCFRCGKAVKERITAYDNPCKVKSNYSKLRESETGISR